MNTAPVPAPPGDELPLGGSALQCRLAGAAIELFYRQGALATTVREITRACDLTPGALYNHFASKEELLYLVVRDIHLRLERAVADAQRAVAGDPAAELAAIVRVYVGLHSRFRQRSRVANREYQLLTGERREEIVAIRRRLRGGLTDVLLAGRRQGLFDLVGGDGSDAAALTAVTIGAMCAQISDWAHERYPLEVGELQDRYAEMALRLAGARPLHPPAGRPGALPPRRARFRAVAPRVRYGTSTRRALALPCRTSAMDSLTEPSGLVS